jgi:transcriptional regulator with XRE-family HTH domain
LLTLSVLCLKIKKKEMGAFNMTAVTFQEVGSNIQRVLKVKGMSQQDLADKLGVSKQVMSKIISGAKAINVSEISRIATILAITVDELLHSTGKAEGVEAFSFMGEIHSEYTRKKVSYIQNVSNELIFLDEIMVGH